jgi:glycosyltransferase involved in cell wall biosynthesis/ActR/RegA family two-component response regulator
MNKTKVLIVDDESLVAVGIKKQLNEFGFDVVGIAATGKEAINTTLQKNPDIILMDIVLQGDMDGIEAADIIHSHTDIPIIYITAYFDEEILRRARLTEPYAYMVKPIKGSELNANLQMAIYKYKSEKKKDEISQQITAIIPALNEQVSIGSVVLKTRMYVDRVIVVDDGSDDRTEEIAVLAGAEIIKHQTNQGKGKALETGFKAAKGSEIVITLDGDGQHSVTDIPKLVKPIINGEADIVNGSRYLNGNDEDTPAYRRVGQNVLDVATNFNAKSDITDSQSGFRAFASYTLPAFKFRESGYGIESEMIIEASNAGFRIKEVPIGVRYDVNGSKKHPITHGIGVLVKVLQDMEFNRPLYYFTFPGILMIIVGLFAGLIFFGSYLNHETSSLAPTTLAALLTLAGTFIAFTGIILHSMSRMIERTMGK